MAAAILERMVSGQKEIRDKLSKRRIPLPPRNDFISPEDVYIAYLFARRINHIQGFQMLRLASENYDWNLDLSEIARIWTNGCIIKSKLMVALQDILSIDDDLFDHQDLVNQIMNAEGSASRTVEYSVRNQISTPAFSASLNYWYSITNNQLPTNLVQAMRDYFGSHQYQRVDSPPDNYFHTNWSGQ
jgi:6-phosphogluconate dehydrogenase